MLIEPVTGDSTWSTYTSSSSGGCWPPLIPAMLARPILSARRAQEWRDSNAVIATEAGGIAIVQVTLDGMPYEYAVDTNTWRIVGLRTTFDGYLAKFIYHAGDTRPVLYKVAINEMEDLSQGGYELTNVFINNGYVPVAVPLQPRVRDNAGFEANGAVLRVGSQSQTAAVFDLAGRMVFAGRGPLSAPAGRAAGTTVIRRGDSDSGRPVGAFTAVK